VKRTFVEWWDPIQTSSATLAEAKTELAYLRSSLHSTKQAIDESKLCIQSSWLLKDQFDRLLAFKISNDAPAKG
jgi:hypothetical protein